MIIELKVDDTVENAVRQMKEKNICRALKENRENPESTRAEYWRLASHMTARKSGMNAR